MLVWPVWGASMSPIIGKSSSKNVSGDVSKECVNRSLCLKTFHPKTIHLSSHPLLINLRRSVTFSTPRASKQNEPDQHRSTRLGLFAGAISRLTQGPSVCMMAWGWVGVLVSGACLWGVILGKGEGGCRPPTDRVGVCLTPKKHPFSCALFLP